MNTSSVRPGLIERGAQQNRAPPPPGWMGPPPGQYGPAPPLAPPLPQMYGQAPLRVLPGDPRIGGMYVPHFPFGINRLTDRASPCNYCGSLGTVRTFFGLDNDLCPVCRGVGRVFA
jgi:hypothetical protein